MEIYKEIKERLNNNLENNQIFDIIDVKLNKKWEISEIIIKNRLTNKFYKIDIWNFKDDLLSRGCSFDIWYIIIDNKYFFKVYFKRDNIIIPVEKVVPVPKDKIGESFYKYYELIEANKNLSKIIQKVRKNVSKDKMSIKIKDDVYLLLEKQNLSLKEKVDILITAEIFMWYRYFLSLLDNFPEDAKDVAKNEKLLEKLYWLGILTFPDIIVLYFVGGLDKKNFIEYLDKVLDKRYLLYQLQEKNFYIIRQNLIADKKLAQNFIKKCKTITRCINSIKVYRTRYNLYVRLIVVNNLYKKWIIPEDKYEVYKKNIESIIKILEEMKKLDKEKKKEKQKQIKEIKKRIDEFLMEL